MGCEVGRRLVIDLFSHQFSSTWVGVSGFFLNFP